MLVEQETRTIPEAAGIFYLNEIFKGPLTNSSAPAFTVLSLACLRAMSP
jgi:hypothetical protein